MSLKRLWYLLFCAASYSSTYLPDLWILGQQRHHGEGLFGCRSHCGVMLPSSGDAHARVRLAPIDDMPRHLEYVTQEMIHVDEEEALITRVMWCDCWHYTHVATTLKCACPSSKAPLPPTTYEE
jgi:hypothetical protein